MQRDQAWKNMHKQGPRGGGGPETGPQKTTQDDQVSDQV